MERCTVLIKMGANVNIPGLLVGAIQMEGSELLCLLIEEGADLEIYGQEALEVAAALASIDILALLLYRGVDINAFGVFGTPLQAAARSGCISTAQYLIENGAAVNAPAGAVRGRTALQAATESGDIEMMQLLRKHHADINALPGLVKGRTALEALVDDNSWLGEETSTDIFKLLVENGATINQSNGEGHKNSTVIHSLIEGGLGELVHLALKVGATVNYMSLGKGGRTPLQRAAEKGDLDSVKLLLASGAEVNAKPAYRYGRTALQAAASNKSPQPEIVQLLLDHQADVNAPAGVTGGITALQGAAICGYIKTALLLLQNGADVNARPAYKDGRSALEGAAEHGHLDMVQLLLNAGAKGDDKPNGGSNGGFRRAIDLAKSNRHFVVGELLEDHQDNVQSSGLQNFG